MELGWKVVVGSLLIFVAAALGSIGGGGSAGIFIPVLTLIVGFDPKSAAAISKCLVMGVAVSTISFNIRRRHPTLDMPVIDYDLALLFQPMLILGISIGVTLNVIFADWMITLVLILVCIAGAIKSLFKGVDMWKKETRQQETDRRSGAAAAGTDEVANNSLPGGSNNIQTEVSIVQNIHWKKLFAIVCVWAAILIIQIAKSHTSNCSIIYWVLNLSQIPVVVAGSGYEAVKLYQGKRVIASRGEAGTHFTVSQLVIFCLVGVAAGSVGGMVGLGIMGPLFLDMGVPPQVTGATLMFIVMFSSSVSVVEYYLLHRFPIPYTLYFVGVATIASFIGQNGVKKVVTMMRRESVIVFILAITFTTSAFFIGSQGVMNVMEEMHHHKYMGFQSMC